MKNLLPILLVLGIVLGIFPLVASADPITDEEISIQFVIDDGDSEDQHDVHGWLVAGSGISSTIDVAYQGSESPDIHYVRFTSVEKDRYGDVADDYVPDEPYETVFSASENVAGSAPIRVQINYTMDGIGYDYYRTVYQPIDHGTPMDVRNIAYENEVTLGGVMNIAMAMEDAYGNLVTSLYEDAIGETPEAVDFSTASYAGSGFDNATGYGAKSVTVPVNAEGLVSAAFMVGIEAGPKYLIHLVPGVGLDDTWLTITALADGDPNSIVVSVNPNFSNPPYQPADGESRFYLIYQVFDLYGNPSGNQALHFSDDVTGDEFTRWTDSDGEVKFFYGPFDYATTVTLHAEAVVNPFVCVDQKLRFNSIDPEGMVLTANPQSMASADVPSALNAQIFAKVMDESGNGVPGETVQFFIISSGWDDAHASDPYLDDTEGVSDTTVTTNADGIATVNFTPGAFTCSGDENYSATASESCDILARGGDTSQTIELEWMNYPYIRVETEVSPETVEVGDTVDVTVRLTGDGWGLYPSPIDVMLCADRSGSMLLDYPDRMVSAMDAMNTFNGKMAKGRDRVGLTSFGAKTVDWQGTYPADIFDYHSGDYGYWWAGNDSYDDYWEDGYWEAGHHGWGHWVWGYYDRSEDVAYIQTHYPGNNIQEYPDYATLDLPLTDEIDTANQTISQVVPMDGTPMRHGLYLAITELIENGTADAVKAIVLLSDGDYNTGGDPLARDEPFSEGNRHRHGYCNGNCYGWSCSNDYPCDYYYYEGLSSVDSVNQKWQNLSVYASDHDITLYSIALGDGLTEDGIDTLETLATSTGGLYYHAPTGDDLTAIYLAIAGELRIEAGVNTTMDLMFNNIERNNVTESNIPDDRILEYTCVDNLSTLVKSWNTPLSPQWSVDSDNMVHPLEFLDQTEEWDENQCLSFDSTEIGTIHLGQIWQTKYRMNVSKPGTINMFGDGSLIIFNDGEETLGLPKTYISAVFDLNITDSNSTLQVYDLVCVEDEHGDAIENYLTLEWNLSYFGTDNVTQNLYYQKVGDGIWTNFDEIVVPGQVPGSLQTDKLYVADLLAGEYKIRVVATAPDATQSVTETSNGILIDQSGQYFIRLG